MKNLCFILSILTVAIISTACINNLAVQDLNNKAKEYMNKGDYTQAIERLKSSLDLDPAIFETHYNLAVAYTESGDYINAVEQYEKALEIKKDPDIYYSLATAQNNLAVDLEQMVVRLDSDKNLVAAKDYEFDQEDLTDDEKDQIKDLYEDAVKNYEKYLQLNPQAADKKEVQTQIERIKTNYLKDENYEE